MSLLIFMTSSFHHVLRLRTIIIKWTNEICNFHSIITECRHTEYKNLLVFIKKMHDVAFIETPDSINKMQAVQFFLLLIFQCNLFVLVSATLPRAMLVIFLIL